MISFLNDYSTGCAKEILDELIKTNELYTIGYGQDEITNEAIKTVRKMINDENAYVHFLVGGTQTNLTLLSKLAPYEAIISANTGHIATHETGAIEATGHKVITVNSVDSKLYPNDIEQVISEHSSFHMVKPKLVYISNTTEYGLIYTREELKALRTVCDKYNLYLFIDGARISQAISNELTLADIHRFADAFYIGGTKNGLLFGECLIIKNNELSKDFKYNIKQKGALLAKGRLLGVQFKRFFADDLYHILAKKANDTACLLREVFKKYNIEIYLENNTNLVFVYLDSSLASYLEDKVLFDSDIIVNNRQIYRFVTCYSTKDEDIYNFDKILASYYNL